MVGSTDESRAVSYFLADGPKFYLLRICSRRNYNILCLPRDEVTCFPSPFHLCHHGFHTLPSVVQQAEEEYRRTLLFVLTGTQDQY